MPSHSNPSSPLRAAHGERRLSWPVLLGAGALLAGAAWNLGTLAYAYFATHPLRFRVRRTPAAVGLPYENITFLTPDGLRLSSWLIPAPPEKDAGAVVIVCHGYPMNRQEMLPHAAMLHAAGYTTLLFDFRALGESEGDLCSVGHHEVEDMRGALDYLASRPDTASLPVGALGHSLGGAVAIMTAAQDARLRAVVAEASYPTLQEAIDTRCRAMLGPLGPPVAQSVCRWAKRWVPIEPCDVAPKEAIRHISPRAVMIIQGQRDPQVRWQEAVAMYQNAREPRELWLLPKSGHARCLADAPDEYARRVTAFFARHLKS
ncbi:MAG TPA: alpha/beta fold hydrolase [Chthonomonadaceae bacterium]|nr:alpha/beta fold hydrolase [Chthonomonadaceae bacterium]